MADSTNEKRPVRKLTVKNFSVIKEAELEFGKITVLIGPQASGKSLLCRLAYFMGRMLIEIATDHVVKQLSLSEFKMAAGREFERWFPRGGWGQASWSIDFRSFRFSVKASESPTSELTSQPTVAFCEEFESLYLDLLKETQESHAKTGFSLAPAVQSRAATRFMKLAGRGVWDAATYIPSERAYFVDIQKGYRALSSELDPVSARFAIAFADSLSREVPKPRLQRFLCGDLVQTSDGMEIAYPDGRQLPLNRLSGGGKEAIAIASILDLYEFRRRSSGKEWLGQELYGERLYCFDDLTIEEPEAGVFPRTQLELVNEFAFIANDPEFQAHLLITTHSPYVLASFNNLIEAGQAARDNPKVRDAIAKIVPEQHWIKDGDFKAYSIHDGKLESILNESGFIEANYLDQVSEVIGNEFDKLLRLEYEHTKAS